MIDFDFAIKTMPKKGRKLGYSSRRKGCRKAKAEAVLPHVPKEGVEIEVKVANVPAVSRRTSGRKRKSSAKAVAASYFQKRISKEVESKSSIATLTATLAKSTTAAAQEPPVKVITVKLAEAKKKSEKSEHKINEMESKNINITAKLKKANVKLEKNEHAIKHAESNNEEIVAKLEEVKETLERSENAMIDMELNNKETSAKLEESEEELERRECAINDME